MDIEQDRAELSHAAIRPCLRKISELLDEQFFVGSYQRGYKWGKSEVEAMLNDLADFQQSDACSSYCLQPVVVRWHDDTRCWELIDGQQRITTIYLILAYLRRPCFKISYETRHGSKEFLNALASLRDHIEASADWNDFLKRLSAALDDIDNVDNYHFYQAWRTIRDWFSKHDIHAKDRWLETLCNWVCVIWYVPVSSIVGQTDSIEIFSRLNSGQIPLENAELVRAILLRRATMASDGQAYEIARSWDSMEQALWDDALWYFVNGDRQTPSNRTELLLDVAAGRLAKNGDRFHTYEHFHRSTEILEEWRKVTEYFSRICEWFGHTEIHNRVGYLIACNSRKLGRNGESLNGLLAIAEDAKRSKFGRLLKERIRGTVQSCDLEELRYGDDTPAIQRVLLLFNIETMGQVSRFPFKDYHGRIWSLEHIHARNSEAVEDADPQRWYKHTQDLLARPCISNKQAKENASAYLERWKLLPNRKSEEARSLRKAVQEILFQAYGVPTECETSDAIENLALLDKDTNASLNNAIFPVKRMRIIERDKKGDFLPIGTKNVFLKYYSKDLSWIDVWGEPDRQNYLDEIKRVLEDYLPRERP